MGLFVLVLSERSERFSFSIPEAQRIEDDDLPALPKREQADEHEDDL